MDYYKLPKRQRWLGDDVSPDNNPYQIDGRDTDVREIGLSLDRIVREWFSPDNPPRHIVHKIEQVRKALDEADHQIDDLILVVSKEVHRRGVTKGT